MRIDGRLPEGLVVLCPRCDVAFLVPRLGLSVECPTCGATELGTDLMTEFLLRNAAKASVVGRQGAAEACAPGRS